MTSDLAFYAFRLLYLGALWLMVLLAVSTLRRDIFGTVITHRNSNKKRTKPVKPESQTGQTSTPQSHDIRPRSIYVTGGPMVGTDIPLGAHNILIGRNPEANLILNDEYVSGRHAIINQIGQEWYIEDLGSRNGTFVDDERIMENTRIGVSANIRIGQTTIELVR